MSAHPSHSEELDWRMSRTCESGACVRIARRGESVLIGNTSNPEGPVSEFSVEEWRNFLSGVKLGDFDNIA
jgi:predicted secreted Zn-dependent protease